MTIRNRQLAGTPVGGQFATTARAEAAVTLSVDSFTIDEMHALHAQRADDPAPFWRGQAEGARMAAEHLAGGGRNLRELARAELVAEGPTNPDEVASDEAQACRGRALTLMYAHHRTTAPALGREWANEQAKADIRRIRAELATTPTERRGLWGRLRSR